MSRHRGTIMRISGLSASRLRKVPERDTRLSLLRARAQEGKGQSTCASRAWPVSSSNLVVIYRTGFGHGLSVFGVTAAAPHAFAISPRCGDNAEIIARSLTRLNTRARARDLAAAASIEEDPRPTERLGRPRHAVL